MASEPNQRLSIAELLDPTAIQMSLRGTRRDQILQELVSLVPALRDRSEAREALLHALREREEMHSTGIGDGLALPHTRTTLGGLVGEPMIVFGRHASGVSYGAIDGKPVHLFFLLLTTSITQHLHVLARMSRLLRAPQLREKLMTAPTPEALIGCMQQAEG
jgi:mannitol/fructose-specific phosphotransferase system IIA component (Ntr-type)